jgi:hypothetical protein
MTEEKKELNYKAIFLVGITFVGAGVAISAATGAAGIGITGMGVVFILIGVRNRDKWKK